MTARAIATVATIWTELERRGEDMSGYKFALRGYMRAVASGRLIPEAVAALAGQLRTLDRVAELPVDEQRRLIDGAPITLVTADGSTIERRLSDMTWTETARVLRGGQIMTPAEQQIAMQRNRKTRRSPAGRPYRILIDDGLMRIGTVTVPLDRVLAALRSAGYTLTDQPMTHSATNAE